MSNQTQLAARRPTAAATPPPSQPVKSTQVGWWESAKIVLKGQLVWAGITSLVWLAIILAVLA